MMPKVTRIRTLSDGKLPGGLVAGPTPVLFKSNRVGEAHTDGRVEFSHPRHNADAIASLQAYGASLVSHGGEVVGVVVRERR
jgi:hypothetical protein